MGPFDWVHSLRNSPVFNLTGAVNPIRKLNNCWELRSESAQSNRPNNFQCTPLLRVLDNIPMPVKRSSSLLKATLKGKIDAGEIECGEDAIFHEISKYAVIDGILAAKDCTIFGRQISLNKIRERKLKRQLEKGVLRVTSNLYKAMDMMGIMQDIGYVRCPCKGHGMGCL